MESAIIETEQKIEELTALMHQYSEQNNLDELQKVCLNIDILQKELERLFHRWQELDDKEG